MNKVDSLSKQIDSGLPIGFRLGWNTRNKCYSNYRILMGGSPWRMIQLDDRSGDFARRIHSAGVQGLCIANGWESKAAGELLVRGFLYPITSAQEFTNEDIAAAIDNYSVVIPILDRAEQLMDLLKVIRTGDQGRTNVIVVDDGSQNPHEMVKVVADYSASIIRMPVNKGPAAARNAGARETQKHFIVFLDSDCLPTTLWIEQLLGHFEDPSVGVVAPRVRACIENSSVLHRYETIRSSLDMGQYPDHVERGGRLGFIPSAAIVVRREVWESVKFEESMRVGEDVDFIWRVLESGWRVNYDPAVSVFHRSRDGLPAWFIRTFEYGTSAAGLETRHPGSLTPARFSGWNIGIMAGMVFDRKVAALTIYLVATGALAWRIRHLPKPVPMAAQIVFFGLLADIEQAGRLLRREWWPLGLTALVSGPRSRVGRRISVVMVSHVINDWREEKPRLDPVRYTAMRFGQDLAYGSGVLTSAVRARVWQPLLPEVRLPAAIYRQATSFAQRINHRLGSSKTLPKFSRFANKR
jgi:mycofactocin system glycosyltransferase